MLRLLPALLLLACSEYEIKPDAEDPLPGEDTVWVDTGPFENCDDFPVPPAPHPEQDDACLNEPEKGSFDPVIEWATESSITYSLGNDFNQPYVMPAIGNLSDDNGDGRPRRCVARDVRCQCLVEHRHVC